MKIQMIRGVLIDGKARKPGEVVEVSERFGNELLSQGRAIPAPVEVKSENRSVGLEVSEEPKPVKRRRTYTKKKAVTDGD